MIASFLSLGILVLLFSINAMSYSLGSVNSVSSNSLSSLSSISGSKTRASQQIEQPSSPFIRGQMSMKKGKPNVPPQMRGQYKQQQQMNQMREQMLEAQSVGADGIPVFNMFVKSGGPSGMWYPCGSFKGDERTKALVESSKGGFLSGMAKNQLDSGVSNSLYDSQKQLTESVVRSYPQLRKSRDNLKWGYKITALGLDEEQKQIVEVVPEPRKEGFLDNVGNLFKGMGN